MMMIKQFALSCCESWKRVLRKPDSLLRKVLPERAKKTGYFTRTEPSAQVKSMSSGPENKHFAEQQ